MLRKSVRLFGLALLGWAITDRGASAEAPLVISDGVSVALVQTESAWQLVLVERDHTTRHQELVPLRHPQSDHVVKDVAIRSEVTGVTVQASYPVHDFLLSYEFTFQYQPPTPHRRCALQLVRSRSEQRYRATGIMRSGMAADYLHRLAQPLAVEGVPSTTALRPIRLLPQDTCWLSLPALYEFSPRLDVLRVQ